MMATITININITSAFPLLPLHGQRYYALSSTVMKAVVSPSSSASVTHMQRRQFLNSAAATSTLAVILTTPLLPAHAAITPTPVAARAQFDAAVAITDRLLKDWDTVTKGGGDAIRKELGTVGTGSPFYQINKAIRVLQNDADDPVAFGDASEQFEIRLAGADAMAYSAIFTGGSGKPTPPAVYFEKSKVEVEALRQVEAEMIQAL